MSSYREVRLDINNGFAAGLNPSDLGFSEVSLCSVVLGGIAETICEVSVLVEIKFCRNTAVDDAEWLHVANLNNMNDTQLNLCRPVRLWQGDGIGFSESNEIGICACVYVGAHTRTAGDLRPNLYERVFCNGVRISEVVPCGSRIGTVSVWLECSVPNSADEGLVPAPKLAPISTTLDVTAPSARSVEFLDEKRRQNLIEQDWSRTVLQQGKKRRNKVWKPKPIRRKIQNRPGSKETVLYVRSEGASDAEEDNNSNHSTDLTEGWSNF